MNTSRIRSAVDGLDFDQDVVGTRFGVADIDIKVAVVVEGAGVDEFVFWLGAIAFLIFRDEFGVRKGSLRILVEGLHPAVGGGALKVVVALLDVLAVVALVAVEAEEALFEDRVGPVPQSETKAEAALGIGESEQAVIAPAVGPGGGLIMGKGIPRVAVGGVILAHGAPLAIGEVGPPAFPVELLSRVLVETLAFGGR